MSILRSASSPTFFISVRSYVIYRIQQQTDKLFQFELICDYSNDNNIDKIKCFTCVQLEVIQFFAFLGWATFYPTTIYLGTFYLLTFYPTTFYHTKFQYYNNKMMNYVTITFNDVAIISIIQHKKFSTDEKIKSEQHIFARLTFLGQCI